MGSKSKRLQRGSALMSAVISTLLMSGVTLAVIGAGLKYITSNNSSVSAWEAKLANKEINILAQYFVANNLVLCQNQGWKSKSGKKCIWGGELQEPAIKMEEFSLSNMTYDKDGALIFDIRYSGKRKLTKSSLSFSLVNWSESAKLKNVVGDIPFDNSMFDDDMWGVLIKASTSFKEKEDSVEKVVSLSSFTRRPLVDMGISVLESPFCNWACYSGLSEDPHPGCRGPQVVDLETTGETPILLTNYGPGVLYQATYERNINFSKEYYPKRDKVKKEINFLEKQDALMPGKSVRYSDQMPCFNPVKVQRTVSTENPSGEGVAINTSYRRIFSYHYFQSVSRYEEKQYKEKGFRESYDRDNSTTYKNNSIKSKIEPKRLAIRQSLAPIQGTQTVETTTVTNYVAPAWDGDGDGSGGNN